MANKYLLDKGLEDSFDYGVMMNGKVHEYTVKYPSQKELRPIQVGYSRLQELDKEYGKLETDDKKGREKIEEEVKKVSDDVAEAFNKLFTPHEGAMPLEELLDTMPGNKKRVFDLMIQAELLDDAEAKAKLKELGM